MSAPELLIDSAVATGQCAPLTSCGGGGLPSVCGCVVEVSVRSSHTCARTGDNSVWCWGNNDYGQLGNNSTSSSNVPVQVALPPWP